MQSIINRVIVKVEKRFEDEIIFESGLKLFKDSSYNPEENAMIYGEVVSAPLRVDYRVILTGNHADENFFNDLEKGDRVYFNYLTLLDLESRFEYEGEEYWIVDFISCIARVRNGEIRPLGSYMLVEPIEEKITSSLIEIPDTVKPIETNQGLVVASNHPDVPDGSIVEFDPIGKFMNKIEGMELYCPINNNIFFVYPKK